ncbi:hypothetical protein [Agromyces larvae]|uniref:DUF998 domain-containing protein n=1 Tax=Agromyces larvae TaxID=2929802 RepID=A0ABY4BYH7_9MICO|nr:hypothetical protein [Agromyces larvae]UOE43247.1 hypothetical protein MTO99_13770 [Agromyces larvae]
MSDPAVTSAPAASTKRRATSLAQLARRPAENAESLESVALIIGALAFAVGALAALVAFWNRDVPISGAGSIGEFVAISGALVAIAAFVLGRLVLRSPSTALQRDVGPGLAVAGARLHWFDLAALALAHGAVVLIAWLGLSNVLERSFIGAVVFTLPAVALTGVGLAVSAYAVFLSAARLTPMLLSLVLAVFLVVGAIASMLGASDPLWWQKNLSALGIGHDASAIAFNVTLIIAGAIVTIIARYCTAALPTSTPLDRRHRNVVRNGLALIGIFLACVGIFSVDQFFWVHNSVATGMAVAYAVVVIGLPWFVPGMPRPFVILGYVYVAVIVVLGVFFAIGYYNLTAVELVAAVLIFSWIILFLRNSSAMSQADAPEPAPPVPA